MECFNYQYAVKLICGRVGRRDPEVVVARGTYFTSINIHNPTDGIVPFQYKVAIALPSKPGPVSDFFDRRLGEDEALEIDCPEIEDILKEMQFITKFAKGFIVIESDVDLDVVAVYTVKGGHTASALHMERVRPRRPVKNLCHVGASASTMEVIFSAGGHFDLRHAPITFSDKLGGETSVILYITI